MTDLIPITIPEMIREIEREVVMRNRLYPRWVAAGQMTQDQSDRQIAAMEAAANELRAIHRKGM